METSTNIAGRLRGCKNEILEIWEIRVREKIPAARELDSQKLRNSLPKVLDQLIRVLDNADGNKTLNERETNLARIHGEERSETSQYDLSQVIEEYYFLRQVVFEVLRKKGPISEKDNDIILDAINIGVRNASTEFISQRKRDEDSNLKLVVEAIHDHGIVQTDAEGIIREWNTGAEKIFGWDRDEIIGQSASIFFSPEDCEMHIPEKEMARARATGKAEDNRWHLKKGGVAFFASGAMYPITYGGHLSGYIKVLRDETHQKLKEDALLEREKELAEFIHQAPVAMVIMKGPDFRFSVANPRYEKLIGRKVIGKTVKDVFSEDEVSHFIPILETVFETGIPFIGEETPLLMSDEILGERKLWLNFTYHPLREKNGLITGIIAIVADVTVAVEARKILEGSKEIIENERENFYNLFRHTPEMVCVLAGPEHTFEFVNEAHIKALGFNAIGRSIREAQPDSVEVHEILDQVYNTGVTSRYLEIPITVFDKVRYFNLTFSPRKNPLGEINGVVLLGTEVTDIFHARRILEDSESRVRKFLNAIPTPLWSAEPDGTIDFLNQYWFEYSGQDPEMDPRSGDWSNIIHPDDLEKTMAAWKKAVRENREFDQVFRLKRHSDQEYRWHRSRGTYLKDESGSIIKWVGYISDINEQRVAIASLTEEREVRERFVATLTHDLRTPLTSARLSSQMLEKRAHDPEAVTSLSNRILKSLDRSDRMIQNLLDANRLKVGEGIPVKIAECDLKRVIFDVMEDLRNTYGDRFYFDEKKSDQLTGQWDGEGLQRILENLIGNAIKYGAEKSIVEIAVTHDSTTVTLSVHNDGNPISEEDQKYLFDPYTRADSAVVTGQKGWGIGLSLVKGLVEAHHGKVWVQSDAKNGTTFFVQLPFNA